MASAQSETLLIHAGTLLSAPPAPPAKEQTIVITDGKIERIENGYLSSVDTSARAGEIPRIIDLSDRFVLPGLFDGHVHLGFQSGGNPLLGFRQSDSEQALTAMIFARRTLAAGFTTVRDLCGTGPGLRNLIDSGFISGPRMYISGACISQTSGHADFRMDSEAVTPNFGDSTLERLGITILADGVDEVLKATRNNLARGADFTKMMGGGGVSSDRDPIESVQGTLEEIGAMVLATGHYGTYGAVHAYHDRSVQRAVNAGIRSIEHGNLMVEPESFKMVADADVWLVPALGGFAKELMDHPYYGNPANPAHFKAKRVNDNGTNWVKLANLYQINMGFGTDIVVVGKRSSRNLRDYQITQWGESFGNLRTLKAMTSDNGKLMALTGTKNPYPNKLGVIEPGAYADLILVDGNPLEDLAVIGAVPSMFKTIPRDTPSVPSIRLVMKNGVVYKNTL